MVLVTYLCAGTVTLIRHGFFPALSKLERPYIGTKNVDGWSMEIHLYPTILFVCLFVCFTCYVVGIIVSVHCKCVLLVKPRT